MKRILAVIAALSLTACATDMGRYYDVQTKAIEADNNAVMALAAAAAQGNQGAIVALALRKSSAGNVAVPQDKALQWASILVNPIVSVYGISKNTQVQLANIAAETERYGTTMNTIDGIATQGIDAASKSPLIVAPSGTLESVD